MLTEFGGIAFSRDTAHTWGYSRGESEEDFAEALPAPAEGRALAAGAGGLLLHAVRRHVPGGQRTALCRPHAEDSRSSTSRSRRAVRARKRDYQIEWEWRERLMNQQRQQYMIPNEDHHTRP